MIERIEKSLEGNPSNEQIELVELGRRQRAKALRDIVEGIGLWRLWFRLGWNDILQKYRRSVLGPFWLTASTATMVVALGVLYAKLFNERIDDFIPFFCAGLLVWILIASYLSEGGTLFTGSEVLHQTNPFAFLHVCLSIELGQTYYLRSQLYHLHRGVNLFPDLARRHRLLVDSRFNACCAQRHHCEFLLLESLARFRDIPQLIASLVQIFFSHTDFLET